MPKHNPRKNVSGFQNLLRSNSTAKASKERRKKAKQANKDSRRKGYSTTGEVKRKRKGSK